MRIVYFDCFSGASGDMILGSLLDAGLNIDVLRSQLSKLRLDGYKIRKRKVIRGGIAGTKFEVKTSNPLPKAKSRQRGDKSSLGIAPDEQTLKFNSLKQIVGLIGKSPLEEDIKKVSKEIFTNIAEAEAQVHGKGISDVHFHEMGGVDLIIDIVGTLIALRELDIERAYCSSLVLGKGYFKSNYGILPIPPPATLNLLKDRRTSFSDIPYELITPTGAAILKTVCKNSINVPSMKISAIGYGAGDRNLEEVPNLLRAIIGETDPVYPVKKGLASLDSKHLTSFKPSSEFSNGVYKTDSILVLETNIDDMNPLNCEPVLEKLYDEGALDVYITSIQMKKSRPGFLLTVLLEPHSLNKITSLLFDETTTFGLRYYQAERRKLDRKISKVKTKYGKVRIKIGSVDKSVKSVSPEYEDCRRISIEKGIPFRRVYEEAKRVASN